MWEVTTYDVHSECQKRTAAPANQKCLIFIHEAFDHYWSYILTTDFELHSSISLLSYHSVQRPCWRFRSNICSSIKQWAVPWHGRQKSTSKSSLINIQNGCKCRKQVPWQESRHVTCKFAIWHHLVGSTGSQMYGRSFKGDKHASNCIMMPRLYFHRDDQSRLLHSWSVRHCATLMCICIFYSK